MKEVQKIVLSFLIGIVAAAGLMLLVNGLPKENMAIHLKESVEVMELEGEYPEMIKGYISSRLDNFTDSIMLLTSVHKADTGLVDRAMNTYRVSYPGETPSQSLVKYGRGEEGYQISAYTRYWHGYQVFLKPLLLFFNYQEIRYVNMYVQLLLISLIVGQLIRKKLSIYIIPYFVMMISLVPISIFSSLQFSGVFLIMNLAVLALLCCFEKMNSKGNMLLFFFIIGMVTSFIDLLTYPMITLGVPIGFCFLLSKEKGAIQGFIKTIAYSMMWGIGYIGMWAGKWVIASIFLKKNVISDAMDAILNRTSKEASDMVLDRKEVVLRNLSTIFETPAKGIFLISILVALIILVYKMVVDKRNHINNWHLLLLPCMPIAWYLVLANHSYIHFWFTYRSLGVLVFGILAWLYKNVYESMEKV